MQHPDHQHAKTRCNSCKKRSMPVKKSANLDRRGRRKQSRYGEYSCVGLPLRLSLQMLMLTLIERRRYACKRRSVKVRFVACVVICATRTVRFIVVGRSSSALQTRSSCRTGHIRFSTYASAGTSSCTRQVTPWRTCTRPKVSGSASLRNSRTRTACLSGCKC